MVIIVMFIINSTKILSSQLTILLLNPYKVPEVIKYKA